MRSSSTRTASLGLVVALVAGACGAAATGGTAAAPATPSARLSSTVTTATPAPAPVTSPKPPAPNPSAGTGPQYTIEQAISDRAQENTIAFDALGFLTGNLGSDSFFPPGKVADFWGFQYLRDNDPSGMGHNTDFLTKASLNMLNVLTTTQRAKLITLAKSQVADINTYGTKRFVLMTAFRRLLDGTIPTGTSGLDLTAVKTYSASLYQLDGKISLARARVMGPMLASLTTRQKATLATMVGQGMTSWPTATEPTELRGLTRDEKVAVMTYAGDMFSWYAGSITADTYFCPERHGTYFGSFYLKDAPAVGNPGYTIDNTLTGNLGAALLAKLDATQAGLISGLVTAQKTSLLAIVDTRAAVAAELRKLMAGGTADAKIVNTLMTTYGQLDGQIVYQYANAFAQVGKTLTDTERADLAALRTQLLGDLALPTGAYLYSQAIPMPAVPSTDFLFK